MKNNEHFHRCIMQFKYFISSTGNISLLFHNPDKGKLMAFILPRHLGSYPESNDSCVFHFCWGNSLWKWMCYQAGQNNLCHTLTSKIKGWFTKSCIKIIRRSPCYFGTVNWAILSLRVWFLYLSISKHIWVYIIFQDGRIN